MMLGLGVPPSSRDFGRVDALATLENARRQIIYQNCPVISSATRWASSKEFSTAGSDQLS
jgi:hypothetical protein